MKEIEEVIVREAHALVDTWMDPEFPAKVAMFMMKLQQEKEARKQKAKL